MVVVSNRERGNGVMGRNLRRVGVGAATLALAMCVGGVLMVSRQQPVHAASATPAAKGTTQAAPTPPAAAPDRIVEQFGNWNFVCVSSHGQQNGHPACEVDMTVQDPKTKLGVTLAIGARPGAGQEHVVVLRVPVSVAVDTPATLSFDGADTVSMPFHTCNPTGCYAGPQAHDDSLISVLRAHDTGANGRIQWRDASGQMLVMEASLHGVTDALQAMAAHQQ
jgi:invasion protein IalB